MPEEVTTKPFVSKRQARMAFARRLPFAKRWAKQTNFATLPERKDAETCTCKASQPLAPGVSRIHGDLCNVHGRYGSCAAAGFGAAPGANKPFHPKALPNAPKPKKAGGGKKAGGAKGGKGRAPIKPKLTDEQKRQQQAQKRAAAQQAKQQEQAKNRAATLAKLGIAPDGQAALAALEAGNQPDPAAVARAGLVQAGLAEQARDGSYRLTASGRAVLGAADQGEAGRAGSTISGARDRTTARNERQAAAEERKRQADAKRAEAQAKRAARLAKQGKKPQTQAPPKRAPAPARGPGSGGGAAPKPVSTGGGGGGQPRQQPQIPQALRDAVQQLSDGQELDPDTIAALVRNGLARLDRAGKPSLTGQGLRILAQRSKAMTDLGTAIREAIAAAFKAQTAEDRAMFAKMGGGGGGGGKGGGGGSKLWPKNPR